MGAHAPGVSALHPVYLPTPSRSTGAEQALGIPAALSKAISFFSRIRKYVDTQREHDTFHTTAISPSHRICVYSWGVNHTHGAALTLSHSNRTEEARENLGACAHSTMSHSNITARVSMRLVTFKFHRDSDLSQTICASGPLVIFPWCLCALQLWSRFYRASSRNYLVVTTQEAAFQCDCNARVSSFSFQCTLIEGWRYHPPSRTFIVITGVLLLL